MTKQEIARRDYMEKIAQIEREQKMSYSDATSYVQKNFPDLREAAFGAQPKMDLPIGVTSAKSISLGNSFTPQKEAEIYAEVKRAAQANKEFIADVHKRMDSHGESFRHAWQECTERFPALANSLTMKLPPGVKIGADGKIVSNNPGTPEENASLNLPIDAPYNVTALFRRVRDLKPTAELADAMMAILVRYEFDTMTLPESMEMAQNFIKKTFPDLAAKMTAAN